MKFPDISSDHLSSGVAKHLLCGLVDPGDLDIDIDIDINIVIVDIVIYWLIQVTFIFNNILFSLAVFWSVVFYF